MRPLLILAFLLSVSVGLSGCFFQSEGILNGTVIDSDEIPGFGAITKIVHFDNTEKAWNDASASYMLKYQDAERRLYLSIDNNPDNAEAAKQELRNGTYTGLMARRLSETRFLVRQIAAKNGDMDLGPLAFLTIADGFYHVLFSVNSLERLEDMMAGLPINTGDLSSQFFAPDPETAEIVPDQIFIETTEEVEAISKYFETNLRAFTANEKAVYKLD